MKKINFTVPAFICALLLLSGSCMAEPTEYDTKKVEYKNLIAKLYLPRTDKKVPVVIAFGGSDPSWGMADANGEMMARNGIAVIGLVYFKMDPSLPPTLDHIPLEYFIEAINYAESVPQIDAAKIGVVSGSRGSEAGFLISILDQRIKSVVITTPSHVAWGGMTTARSAWTYQGKDVPSMRLPDIKDVPQLQRFAKALEDKEQVRKAMFAFEKINGPLLLVSASNDQIWPSTPMSKQIVDYLKAKQFPHQVDHKIYPTGHGFSSETAPEIKQMIIDHFVRTLNN